MSTIAEHLTFWWRGLSQGCWKQSVPDFSLPQTSVAVTGAERQGSDWVEQMPVIGPNISFLGCSTHLASHLGDIFPCRFPLSYSQAR